MREKKLFEETKNKSNKSKPLLRKKQNESKRKAK